MTRLELALLLTGEEHHDAANRILNGEDPVRVLNAIRPFVPMLNDSLSRAAVTLFKDIIDGRVTVR